MNRDSSLALAAIAIAVLILVSEAKAIRILVYDHNSMQHLARDAATSIAPLGFSGTTVTGASNFYINLHSSDSNAWDVVVVDCPGTIPSTPSGGWGPLIEYVNAGGSVVMSYWNWDAFPSLTQAFGIDSTSSKLDLIDSTTNFVGLSAGIDLSIYTGVDTTNNDWVDHWGDDGDIFNLASGGATAIGGVGIIGASRVIARKSNGNAIACFVLDEAGPSWVTDARALWRNMILNVAKSTCSLDLVVDLSPGTGPPPTTLGPYTMTPFPSETPCPPATLFEHPSPLGGTVICGMTEHRTVVGGPASTCATWSSWSHGYTGDVFFSGIAPFLDTFILLPPNTGAFYFYAQPLTVGVQSLGIRLDKGTSFQVPISGAGGAQYIGVYATGGVLHEIELYNPIGQTPNWAVAEFGIAPAAQVQFSGGPGTGAAPVTLGPYVLSPFPPLACTTPTVNSIPAPFLGDIRFSAALDHARVGGAPSCASWPSWSHGYTGDVYVRHGPALILYPPPGTGALRFYVQPLNPGSFDFVVQTNDGQATSGVDAIAGESGAEYFGFYAAGGGKILSITIQQQGGGAGGFAVGEFAIAQTRCALTCVGDTSGDGLINGVDLANLLGSWSGALTYARCPPYFMDGDLNGDCRINGLDLALMLAAWGPCP